MTRDLRVSARERGAQRAPARGHRATRQMVRKQRCNVDEHDDESGVNPEQTDDQYRVV